jgi:hypothetical protein
MSTSACSGSALSKPRNGRGAGRTLHFDPQTYTFAGEAEANRYLTRPESRKPWPLPAITELQTSLTTRQQTEYHPLPVNGCFLRHHLPEKL